MQINWWAVLFGWLIDFIASLIIQALLLGAGQERFFQAPDLSQPRDLAFLGLFVLSTGVGGFIAARRARQSYVMHGLLVGIVGVLIGAFLNAGQLAVPRAFVIGQVAGCAVGALGGLVALWQAQRRQA